MSKIIRDIVYGYIEIDDFIEKIINTLSFQRLKDIKQLTAQHVFPSANHNRFEHSLGVYHLSVLASSPLKRLLMDQHIDDKKIDDLLFNFNIASLLHDIGHAPFSHLGEKYYQSKDKIASEIKNLIEHNNLSIKTDIFSTGSKHELMSCYVLLSNYKDLLGIDKRIDFELLCRCIVGKEFSANLNDEEIWVKNIIIKLLNSGTIDIDKIDYLIRDAYMTGVSVPGIDIDRLFKNFYLNPDTKKLTFHHRALPVIQNIIEARDSMYLWVYNHHVTVYTDFIIEY